MLGKAEKVKEICDVEYFTNDDIEYIRAMDKDKLELVWDMIKYYVDDFKYGFGCHTCPFCIYCSIYHDGCIFKILCILCPYGKVHGVCDDDDSDFRKIINSKNFSHSMVTNEFYKGLIQEIENY